MNRGSHIHGHVAETIRNLLPPQTTSLGRARLPYATQPLAAYAPYGVGGQPTPSWLPPNDVGSDAQKGPQQQWLTDRLRGLAPTCRRQMRVATSLWGVSWPGTNRFQEPTGHLGGAQEWPRESLTRALTNSETGQRAISPTGASRGSSRNKPKTRTCASFDFAAALCSMQNALRGLAT